MNLLSARERLFNISNASNPCTQGVDLSPFSDDLQHFATSRTSGAAPAASAPRVGYLDVEGQGDRDVSYDCRLASPVLLLSKCVIFNWKDTLQKDRILNMLMIASRAANGVDAGEGREGRPTERPFGHLHIVMRDWNFADTDPIALLGDLMTPERGTSADVAERNAARIGIRDAFQTIRVWLFPPPVSETSKLSKELTYADLSDPFKRKLEELRGVLAAQLAEPTRYGGQALTPRRIAGLLPHIVETINSGKVIMPRSMLANLMQEMVQNALLEFSERLNRAQNDHLRDVRAADVRQQYERTVDAHLVEFRRFLTSNNIVPDIAEKALERAERTLNGAKASFVRSYEEQRAQLRAVLVSSVRKFIDDSLASIRPSLGDRTENDILTELQKIRTRCAAMASSDESAKPEIESMIQTAFDAFRKEYNAAFAASFGRKKALAMEALRSEGDRVARLLKNGFRSWMVKSRESKGVGFILTFDGLRKQSSEEIITSLSAVLERHIVRADRDDTTSQMFNAELVKESDDLYHVTIQDVLEFCQPLHELEMTRRIQSCIESASSAKDMIERMPFPIAAFRSQILESLRSKARTCGAEWGAESSTIDSIIGSRFVQQMIESLDALNRSKATELVQRAVHSSMSTIASSFSAVGGKSSDQLSQDFYALLAKEKETLSRNISRLNDPEMISNAAQQLELDARQRFLEPLLRGISARDSEWEVRIQRDRQVTRSEKERTARVAQEAIEAAKREHAEAQAARDAAERAARDATDAVARERAATQAARDATERRARDAAEEVARERAAREAAKREQAEAQAARDAAERRARDAADAVAHERAAREAAKREKAEAQAARDAAEREARDAAARERKAAQAAEDAAARERAATQAVRDAADAIARERAAAQEARDAAEVAKREARDAAAMLPRAFPAASVAPRAASVLPPAFPAASVLPRAASVAPRAAASSHAGEKRAATDEYDEEAPDFGAKLEEARQQVSREQYEKNAKRLLDLQKEAEQRKQARKRHK